MADQGEIIYKKSFGSADKENNLQNSDTTKFLIASVSKPITAILILRLMDKGMLKLDDTLNKYFTNLDSKIGKISIHQLLSHTAGINEIINEEKGTETSPGKSILPACRQASSDACGIYPMSFVGQGVKMCSPIQLL